MPPSYFSITISVGLNLDKNALLKVFTPEKPDHNSRPFALATGMGGIVPSLTKMVHRL